jgi:hypothetical protein
MLRGAGIETWEYATLSRINVARALDRTMLGLKAGFATHEADEATVRTRETK